MRPSSIASDGGRLFVYLSCEGGTMRAMTSFSVAPHAQPGDDFAVIPCISDFAPEDPGKPLCKGKVAKDVTVEVDLDAGDYWLLVGDTSIRFASAGRAPKPAAAKAKKA